MSRNRVTVALPVALSVVRRHVVRGPRHTSAIARRWAASSASASGVSGRGGVLALLESGDLSGAHDAARAGGRRRLAEYVAGEMGVLMPGLAVGPDGFETVAAQPPQPTVLHLVTTSLPYTVAGYTVRTQGIVAAQREGGLDAHVVTRLGFPVSKGHLRARGYDEVDGVPHHRLLAPLPLRADHGRDLDVEHTTRLAERLRPAVLHAHSHHLNGQVAIEVGRRLRIPVVYEVRGFLEETWASRGHDRDSDFHRLSRAAETWCLERADAVVTISEGMRAAIAGRGIDPAKVTVAPNAVPSALLYSTPLPWRVAPGALVAGVVGTLNDYEGVDVLLEAAARLTARGTAVHVLVVGDGPARPALEALARDLAVPHTFTGRVAPDRVARWHASIDVYAVPRRDLPVTRLVPPLKPVEAMALARPVVASDLPPLRELVRPGETGLLVPPGDADALADALAALTDPAVRRSLGAAGRRTVAAERTWPAVHRTLLETYRGLGVHLTHEEGVRHVR